MKTGPRRNRTKDHIIEELRIKHNHSFFQECLDRARVIYAAKGEQLEGYLVSLTEAYNRAPLRYKEEVQRNLERTILTLEGIVLDREESASSKRLRRIALFDYQKAEEIRVKAGLTTYQLEDVLGVKGVQHYEDGSRIPTNPPRGEFSKKYLAWLKEQGYNPYDL
ncbi:MAG: hypothetical protein WCV90_02755 [Candidatus Woesearchaeota archaeon]|jgi:hypothetical protein